MNNPGKNQVGSVAYRAADDDYFARRGLRGTDLPTYRLPLLWWLQEWPSCVPYRTCGLRHDNWGFGNRFFLRTWRLRSLPRDVSLVCFNRAVKW